jgi:DNA-binding MarR family transcriptional regulator
MAPADPEAAARVLRQFRVVFKSMKTHFQQLERKAGLGGAQVWALSIVRERPGIGVGELAAALNVRQPTASILVKNLVQQRLVESRRSEHDRRALCLHVRPEGRALLRRLPGPHAGVLPEALAALPPAKLAALERGLAALVAELGADEAAGSTPLAELSRG